LIAAESGGVQFTEDGLSGICIFNLNRQIKLSAGVDVSCAMGAYEISIDFVPELLYVILQYLMIRKRLCIPNLL